MDGGVIRDVTVLDYIFMKGKFAILITIIGWLKEWFFFIEDEGVILLGIINWYTLPPFKKSTMATQ